MVRTGRNGGVACPPERGSGEGDGKRYLAGKIRQRLFRKSRGGRKELAEETHDYFVGLGRSAL